MSPPDRRGLIHYRGGCWTCCASWESRNVLGIAARHATAHPDHEIWVELGHSYRWGPDARATHNH